MGSNGNHDIHIGIQDSCGYLRYFFQVRTGKSDAIMRGARKGVERNVKEHGINVGTNGLAGE